MAKVTMELIKQLRDKTQVGMMDCKKALLEVDGDFEKAIESLRKKGVSVAAKRAGHETNNGRITAYISPDYKIGAMTTVTCETDFSANTDEMQKFSQNLCEHVAQSKKCCDTGCGTYCVCDPKCLLKTPLFNNEKMTIQESLDELIAKITENIKIAKALRFRAGKDNIINAYIHPGATLGVMIELITTGLAEEHVATVAQLARDLCMQIAVTNPVAIDPSKLDPEVVKKERAFFKEQLAGSKKPAQIIEKIMVGRMNKYYEDVCLSHQKYIKDDKIDVDKQINNIATSVKSSISIKRFVRFAIGK